MKISIITLAILLFLGTSSTVAQITRLNNQSTIAAEYVGWQNTSGTQKDLDITNNWGTQSINFSTNDGTTTAQRMIIQDDGSVGIGTTTPGFLLELGTGDLNLNNGIMRIGDNSMVYRDDVNNVAIGVQDDLGALTTGANNLFVGRFAGDANTSGSSNVIVGRSSGTDNTEGISNVFVGTFSGESNTTADFNTFIGECAGREATTGGSNTAIGANAGFSNTTGTNNTNLGINAGFNMTVGIENVLVGSNAGRDLTSSADNDNNVIIGAQAGFALTAAMLTATDLTLVGFNAEAANALTNATAIGANAKVTADDCLVLGGITGTNGGTNTNVGIGITAPTARLHVLNDDELITGHFVSEKAGMTDILKAEYDELSTGNVDGIDVSITSTGTSGSYTNVGVRSVVDSDADPHVNYGFHGTASGSTTTSYGAYALCKEAAGTNYGVFGEAHSSTNSRDYGVFGKVRTGTTSEGAYGVWGEASTSSDHNYGGAFRADGSSADENTGVNGVADGATTNYGGYFAVSDADATTNYGVYASAAGTNATNYAGYFVGDVYTTTNYSSSDRKLKSDISELDEALDLIVNLRPSTYHFNTDKYPQLNLPEVEQFGFIADELKEVLPQLVKTTTMPKAEVDGIEYEAIEFDAVNYVSIVPLAVKAIQEQQELIEAQSNDLTTQLARINELEQEVRSLKGINQKVIAIQQQLNDLSNAATDAQHREVVAEVPALNDDTELYQNRPNPFRSNTEIAYRLGSSGKVDLSIYSADGRFVSALVEEYKEKGDHVVLWETQDLPNGIYIYILSMDGVEYVKRAIRLD